MKLPTKEELKQDFLASNETLHEWALRRIQEAVRVTAEEARREALDKAMSILRARSMLSSMHKTDCDAIRYSLQEIEALKAAPATAEAGKAERIRDARKESRTTTFAQVHADAAPPAPPPSAEQRVRDMLERLGVKEAQSYSSGDLVELANAVRHASTEPPSKAVTEERVREIVEEALRPTMSNLADGAEAFDARLRALEAAAKQTPNYEGSLRDIRSALGLSEHDDHESVIEEIKAIRAASACEHGIARGWSCGECKTAGRLPAARSAAGGTTGETRTVGEVPFEEIKDLLSGHPLRRPQPSSEQIDEAYRRGWNDLLTCAIDWSCTDPGEEPNTLAAWVAHAQARHTKAPAAREGSGA